METSLAKLSSSALTERQRRLQSLAAARPRTVAVATLLVYLAALVPVVSITGADSFARVGWKFTKRSDLSARISELHTTAETGYDGQFAYFIALDPLRARYYIDSPSYRYGRVFYPATARAAALGQPGAIPFTLIAVNLLAIVGTVWILGRYLRSRRVSAWWAAVYGLFPGIVICLFADLTEPLAYFLATAALLLLLERKSYAVLSAGMLFALAALTRETTLVFALVGAGWLALEPRNGRRLSSALSAALLLVLAAVPYGAYRLLVDRWLGIGLQSDSHLSLWPFFGLTRYPFDDVRREILLIVILPGLAWLALAVWSGLRFGFDVAAVLLVGNAALFVVWLPWDVYGGLPNAYRALTPIVVSALLLLPRLRRRLRDDLLFGAVLSLTAVWGVIAAWLALLTTASSA